jgi:transposase
LQKLADILVCRHESGSGGIDGRATGDVAVVGGGGQDRAAPGVPRADHSGLGRGAEQRGGGGALGDASGDSQQVACLFCAAGSCRFGGCAAQWQAQALCRGHRGAHSDGAGRTDPAGYARWNGPLLARHLGDTSKHQIWRVLRAHGISLERRRRWCISTDPAFAQKAADIVALYLQPPDNAVILSVDEKPHIPALERAQGWLRLPNGKALTGFSQAYKRHGTTSLFAALDVATGLVKAGHYRRRRRVEFLDFMNRLVADYPERELHVILDNLNTHKPKHDRWRARHKNVHFHFTPTHASWLNQVEVWFSILSSNALAGASFTSPPQVRDQIDAFIAVYNQDAHPFEWTKQVVCSQHPRPSYTNLRN